MLHLIISKEQFYRAIINVVVCGAIEVCACDPLVFICVVQRVQPTMVRFSLLSGASGS